MNNATLVPRNFTELVQATGSIYETTAVIAKRAKQVVVKTKEELNEKFAEFAPYTDHAEEVFENKERTEISKHYERQAKPTVVATREFLTDAVMHRYADIEETTNL